ncbi:hypothetical protein SAMN02745247_01828 [Butyrivibrio hungatei DSM 14810]|uniref:Uncharacterized protein n=1 Tax=Butyrivibrio hungatei DSM 14810 TaxID=1121132 RepID=A0A1M7SII4_9FIRM|nr:hypothetical protein [Butyrivibrio hungatei]SHN58264.1 hypothetical protein SAMN02745247_01828 [Butyrivibrio hungatei DSM 14810]
MSRTFRYIQNDDVLKSFKEFRDSILSERPVVIARHGDYSLFLRSLSHDTLGLTIENTAKKIVVESRNYEVQNTTDALVSRGVRHAIQKMSELSDEETNRKRLQIWKWYIMDWQQKNPEKRQEMMNKELEWKDDEIGENDEMLDFETFLHREYLNLGNTLALIGEYLKDERHKEMFTKFAIEDIMEMTSEDTRDKSIAEAERLEQAGGHKKHTYQFTVSVEATDKEHARQALLNYLAGDERIRVQK